MNVVFFGFKRQGLAYLDEQQALALRAVEVRANDVLLNITGASIGRVTLAPRDMDGARVNQHVCIIRPNAALEPRYLAAYLSSPVIQAAIGAENYGVTRQALTKEQVLAIEVPVESFAHQQRIADKLDALLARVDSCRDRLDRVTRLMESFRLATLRAGMSGRLTADWRALSGQHSTPGKALPPSDIERATWYFDEIPAQWRWMVFRDVFTDETDSSKKLPQAGYSATGKLPVVDQGAALVGGRTDRLELMSTADLPVVVFGDHTRCLKYVDFEFVQGADGVKVLSPVRHVTHPKFAHMMLSAAELPDKGYSRHMKFLRASVFPIPPLEEQAEIVCRIEAFFSLADAIEDKWKSACDQVERLTPALLAKAFRGELVPQDPNDEPASVLLARIEASRGDRAFSKPRGRRPAKSAPASN